MMAGGVTQADITNTLPMHGFALLSLTAGLHEVPITESRELLRPTESSSIKPITGSVPDLQEPFKTYIPRLFILDLVIGFPFFVSQLPFLDLASCGSENKKIRKVISFSSISFEVIAGFILTG
jgi:hypothetical protein